MNTYSRGGVKVIYHWNVNDIWVSLRPISKYLLNFQFSPIFFLQCGEEHNVSKVYLFWQRIEDTFKNGSRARPFLWQCLFNYVNKYLWITLDSHFSWVVTLVKKMSEWSRSLAILISKSIPGRIKFNLPQNAFKESHR